MHEGYINILLGCKVCGANNPRYVPEDSTTRRPQAAKLLKASDCEGNVSASPMYQYADMEQSWPIWSNNHLVFI